MNESETKVLDRDDLLAACASPSVERRHVPRLGGVVLISELDSRLAALVDAETHESEPAADGRRGLRKDGLFNARWLAATLRRPDGTRMFTVRDSLEERRGRKPLFDAEELDRLAGLPTGISESLVKVALALNGLGEDAVEVEAKN